MAEEIRIGKGEYLGEIVYGDGVVAFDPQLPCAVRDRRSTMNDGDFWEDVAISLGHNTTPDDLEAIELDQCFGISAPEPCPECGSSVACGYDSEGRPMMHIVERDD